MNHRNMSDSPAERRFREVLHLRVEEMSGAQVRQLAGIAAAIMRPITEDILPGSAIVGSRFADNFRASLRAHHGTHVTPMDRLAFENSFKASMEAEGHTVEAAPSATTRFWDVKVDGKPTSVKSTAARNIKQDMIHISKLCEAAWIQDVRSATTRRTRTVELFTEYLSTVQAWFLLRIFRQPAGFRYELVEIPVDILRPILTLPRSLFDSDSPRIDVPDQDGKTVFRLQLDRADAKVTLGQLRIDACIVHGRWELDLAEPEK